jgi:tRNA A37 threonylcarbamoyladenosine dehydratase
MTEAFSRSELLLGSEALARLEACTVAVVGLGGVGSWCAEALARAGVGGFVLVDHDTVAESNINRQVIAAQSTIGLPKVEVMRRRILDINPGARVTALQEFYSAESAGRLLPPGLSYVVDAIDSVSSKVDLIVRSRGMGVPVISVMGAGNKLDPTRFEVSDIYGTSVCPLARVMRRELRKRGVQAHKVVWSREEPSKADGASLAGGADGVTAGAAAENAARRSVPGSVSFVPPVAGFIIAAEVVRALAGAGKNAHR